MLTGNELWVRETDNSAAFLAFALPELVAALHCVEDVMALRKCKPVSSGTKGNGICNLPLRFGK